MLILAGLPSNGAWEFIDIPDQYIIDKCDRICLLFCNHLGELTIIVLSVSQFESNPASELTCLCATKCIPLYKEFSEISAGYNSARAHDHRVRVKSVDSAKIECGT